MRLQGEQLRGVLQLQVLHPLPGLLAGVLSVHRSHRVAVFHQILDGESQQTAQEMRVGLHAAARTDGRMALTSPLVFSVPSPSSAWFLPLCYPPVGAH